MHVKFICTAVKQSRSYLNSGAKQPLLQKLTKIFGYNTVYTVEHSDPVYTSRSNGMIFISSLGWYSRKRTQHVYWNETVSIFFSFFFFWWGWGWYSDTADCILVVLINMHTFFMNMYTVVDIFFGRTAKNHPSMRFS